VVPNFIDTTKYTQSLSNCQRSALAKDDEKIITHVSNLRKVKRIGDVITIFHLVQKEIKSKLIMVGQGPEREMAEDLVIELGLEEKVLFLGESHEIDKVLSYSDLFLLPSEKESFGLAALEAMVNGVPVISTNSGGLPEVNKQGFSGYLSNVGDVEEMAANAISILRDENILKQFKENARKQSYIFDIYSVVPLYEDLYMKAMEITKAAKN
jgi:L-malate glycosyltransferase